MESDFSNGTGALKLTLFRFFLAPLFMLFYINPPVSILPDEISAPLFSSKLAGVLALAVLLLVILSDFFDGKIARKYKQVSDLGKILDPLADVFFFLIFYTAFDILSG